MRLGVVSGLADWERRLDAGVEAAEKRVADRRAAADDDRGEVRLAAARRHAGQLRSLRAFFRTLHRTIELVPERGTWEQYVGVTRLLLASLRPDEDREAVSERIEGLRRLNDLDPEVQLGEFIEVVREILDQPAASPGRFQRGGVLLTEVMRARALPLEVVIVPGMVEGVFPRRASEDPVLLDRDRAAINTTISGDPEHPLPLARQGVASGAAEERLLFHLTKQAGRRQVVLSWPRVEEITSREWMPSFFLLAELEARLGRRVALEELREVGAPLEWVSTGSVAPQTRDRALTSLERDLFDVREALRSGAVAGAARVLARTPFGAATVAAERARWEVPHFTEYDGLLPAEGSTADLRDASPRAWQPFSASRLQTYATCPYRYFLGQVLRLEALDEPERQLVVSPLDRGSIFHDVLARFYQEAADSGRLPLDQTDPAGLHRDLQRHADEVLDEFAVHGLTGPRVLWEAVADEIRGELAEWLEHRVLEAPDSGLVPKVFEQPFGWEGSGGGPWVTLDVPQHGTVSFRGYIDRIDVAPDQSRGVVIDYKTGKYRKLADNDLAGGEALQLPIYLLAARALYPEVASWEAIFDYGTRERGKFETVRVVDGEPTVSSERVAQLIAYFIDGMTGGRFFYRPSNVCKGCEFREACGAGYEVAHARKTNDPVWLDFMAAKEAASK